MKSWRHTTVLVVLGAYAVSGLLLEALHHDMIAVRLTADSALLPHSCGERERHAPLDQVQKCAVCGQSSQRVSTPVAASPVLGLPRLFLVTQPVERIQLRSPLATLSDSRGPPVA